MLKVTFLCGFDPAVKTLAPLPAILYEEKSTQALVSAARTVLQLPDVLRSYCMSACPMCLQRRCLNANEVTDVSRTKLNFGTFRCTDVTVLHERDSVK